MSNGALVTGASTGIGLATAQLLAGEGYTVFAGVRSEADFERLQRLHERVRPVRLEVRSEESIAAAFSEIAQSGVPLQAVVNNAGIAVAGPLEYVPLEDVRRQFDVNVFGALAVTQAALPLLRKTHGRILFISSISGQIAPPFVGPYAASKFALEALADSLRIELAPFGMHVVVVQPGDVRTPIWAKGRSEKDALIARMPAQAMTHYSHVAGKLERVTERGERDGIAAETVAAIVLQALRARRPRARYAVGNPPGWQRRIAALLPEHVRDRLIARAFNR